MVIVLVVLVDIPEASNAICLVVSTLSCILNTLSGGVSLPAPAGPVAPVAPLAPVRTNDI